MHCTLNVTEHFTIHMTMHDALDFAHCTQAEVRARYTGLVVHLVTAADGAEQHYGNDTNEVSQGHCLALNCTYVTELQSRGEL